MRIVSVQLIYRGSASVSNWLVEDDQDFTKNYTKIALKIGVGWNDAVNLWWLACCGITVYNK